MSAPGSSEVNQQVTKEGTSSQRAKEMDTTSQKDVKISPVTSEQAKDAEPDLVEQSQDEKLDELKLGDISLDDDVTVEDLSESPMQYEEMMRSHKFSNEESYLTDDDVTMNTSFRTAMKDADRAEGVTAFSDIPEHLIERTQTGKIINVRSPSPNSPTSNLKRQIRELQTSLEDKECQLLQKKQEYQKRISSLETHVYEMEQQQGILENAATEWKIRYERQKEIAEEAQKVADDKEVEKFIAVDELNESMSEETAEKSRQLAELKDQCDELRKKANEAEVKRNDYATKLAEATQRLATMSTDMLKLRNDLKQKEENIGILQKESQAHQKRADEALQVAKELTELGATEGERLKAGIKEVNEENMNLTEQIKKLTEESQKWQAQAYRLDTMVTALEIADKENQRKVHEQLEENIRLNTELTAMATTAMLREDEATEVKNQLISAGQAYTELEQQVNQLAERMITLKEETHKEMDNRTIKLQNDMLKIRQDNDRLRKERDDLSLRNRRLEDENKGLQMTNKHKDEQLLQFSTKKDTKESPPPSYSKAHGTGGSAHFEMPLRTGGGRSDFKTEKDDETSDKRNPSSSHQPHMSSGDPSQPQPTETAIKDDANRDVRSPRHEHDGRYFREYRNERNERNERNQQEDRNEDRGQREFNRAIKNMGRKTDLATFDGNRDAVNGWIRIVKETQRTYDLTDEQIMIDIASAVRGPAKIWFDSESDIKEAEEEVYTVTEWLNKFKDEYGDRNEEVLGLREAMARKFKPGKETLEQFYQVTERRVR
ncbi:myosin-16-like [Paramacrobiotus metropolitanus]|uniref:myosin-16-like n=1 Tax=Paramacrobiotus metropolitanus TaxID=2943436 RepID=UPI0024465059|nr:myosin-16-like [Paramacrobiotus metropolitanus]